MKTEKTNSAWTLVVSFVIVAGIILAAMLLSGCKTCVPVVEYRDSIRTVEVRTHDTTIMTAADSASLQLLLRCDSTNNVLIDEVNTANGDRLSLQLKLQRLLNGQSQLNIQCREDSLLQIIQWQDSIISTMTHQTIVQQVEVVPPYYRGCSVALWIIVALLAIGITIRILIKFTCINNTYIAMKDLIHSWKFWVAIAAAVLLVVGIVLYLCVPEFKDLVKSIGICLGCILAGFIGGYFVGRSTAGRSSV